MSDDEADIMEFLRIVIAFYHANKDKEGRVSVYGLLSVVDTNRLVLERTCLKLGVGSYTVYSVKDAAMAYGRAWDPQNKREAIYQFECELFVACHAYNTGFTHRRATNN